MPSKGRWGGRVPQKHRDTKRKRWFFLACIHRKFVVCRWVTASTPPWYYIRMYWSLSSVCVNDIIFSQRIYSTVFALNRPVMLPEESQLVNFALLILIWRDFFVHLRNANIICQEVTDLLIDLFFSSNHKVAGLSSVI